MRTKRAALAFVDRVGFCYAFTGGPGGLPGLFDVLATRSIDRKWEWAWQWKDDLASDKKLFYGKVIRRKPTYVSLRYVPYFYALTGNVGAHDDHLQAYREGRLSLLAKDIYEYLRAHGTCSTGTLRRLFVTRGGVGAAFHRALADLQNHLLIGKVAESKGGTYSFIWDTFDRWLPQSIRTAARITGAQAAAHILARYLQTTGAIPISQIARLFDWPPPLVADAERALAGTVVRVPIDGEVTLAHVDAIAHRLPSKGAWRR
ncbi:MAG TPA: hypothetical protein VGA58_00575 [bacterium]